MILDQEDYALVSAYIKAIKQQETVLWEGRMTPIDIKNTLPKDEVLLIINLVLLLIGLSIASFLPLFGFVLIIGSVLLFRYLFNLQKQQKATQYYKLKHSKYLVTPKRCVVIHWYQDQIHINTVSATSIQKVQTYRTPNGEISVLFDTKPSSDFEMAYYIDNAKTDSIGFINIGRQANQITTLIREQVLKEI